MNDDDEKKLVQDLLGKKLPMSVAPILQRRMMPPVRTAQYAFPPAVLEPGEEKTVTVDLTGAFRASKLLLMAWWAVIRGRYRIKRSRLPLLNRDNVIAYSEIKRRASKRARSVPGRTWVEFYSDDGRLVFRRSYLPSSVLYIPTEAAECVYLRNILLGQEKQMPDAGGVLAEFFGPNVIGNGLYMPTVEKVPVSLVFKNVSDVQIHVYASMLGTDFCLMTAQHVIAREAGFASWADMLARGGSE